jgi:imidazoleglycerol phosphate synthase glutamine amidotransferase subunit HisH
MIGIGWQSLFILGLIFCGLARAEGPVVGLVFLPRNDRTRLNGSYFLSTYHKWLGQMGIRWIPMYMDDPESVWLEKINKVNGVFLTGGGTPILDEGTELEMLIDPSNGQFTRYGKFVDKTVKHVQKLNDEGTYKAIWGTCLGFESLMLSLTNRTIELASHLENLVSVLPIDFLTDTGDLLNSVFSTADYDKIRSTKTFYYNHHFGFRWQDVENHKWIQENLRLHSTVTTITGHKVLASFEHKKYPFFAVQYHPENGQFAQREQYPSDQIDFELEMNRKVAKVARHLFRLDSSPLTNDQVYNYRMGITFQWLDNGEGVFINRDRHRENVEATVV